MAASTDRSDLTLTKRGARTRGRIITAAAQVIFERGVEHAKIDDVKALAGVSSSQMYHYFADKEALVRAVILYQADTILSNQRTASLDSIEGLRAWRNMIVDAERAMQYGGCPLGSLGSQLAQTDPQARADVADGFTRWEGAIRDGLRAMHARGHLPSGVDPDDLALTLLAALQGGFLLTQIQRDTKPLETALDTMIGIIELLTARTDDRAGPAVTGSLSTPDDRLVGS